MIGLFCSIAVISVLLQIQKTNFLGILLGACETLKFLLVEERKVKVCLNGCHSIAIHAVASCSDINAASNSNSLLSAAFRVDVVHLLFFFRQDWPKV